MVDFKSTPFITPQLIAEGCLVQFHRPSWGAKLMIQSTRTPFTVWHFILEHAT